MRKTIRLLHLEDTPRDAEMVRELLISDGLPCEITLVQDGKSFEIALAAAQWDLILCDFNLPAYDGLTGLTRAKQICPQTPVLILSGSLSPEEAVKCMRAGAANYVLKQRFEGLTVAVRQALQQVKEHKGRLAAEAALHESEGRLRLAVQVAALGMWDVNLETGAAQWNEAAARQLGLPMNCRGTATMELWKSRVFPADLPRVLEELEHARRTGTRFTSEHRLAVGEGGGVRWNSMAGNFFYNDAGKPNRLLCVLNDITERKRAEEELARYRENLETTVEARTAELQIQNTLLAEKIAERNTVEVELLKLSRAVENSPVMVIITNVNGSIEYLNPMFTKITGFSINEALGQTPRILKSGAHTTEFYKSMWRKLQAGETWQGEFHNKRKNGELYWQSASIAPIRDASGKVTHFVAVMEDVTERRQIAEELRKAKEDAESANKAKSMFLANMSHEIRTPINGIVGFNYLLMQTKLSVRQRDYTVKIDTSARALMMLIDDILDFSKVEAGKVELETIEFDLDEVLSNVVQLTSLRVRDKRLNFKIDVAERFSTRLMGDPFRLGQVLLNLVNNAIKFTEKGEVAILVTPIVMTDKSAILRFSVRDTGIGLSQKQIERIFEPFSQATAATTRKYGGTGLGLAIATRLIDMMGGTIEVQSQISVGTTFTFTSRFGRPKAKSKESQEIYAVVAGRRAMVIDSVENNRHAMAEMLKQLSFDVESANSPQQAIELLKPPGECAQQGFDLVVLDSTIDGSRGAETARAIRDAFINSVPPSLILVNGHGSNDLQNSSDDDFDAVLLRPVTRSALYDAIMQALSTSMQNRKAAENELINVTRSDSILHGAHILLVEDNESNQQVATELLELAGCVVTVASNGEEALACLLRSNPNTYFDTIIMDLQMGGIDGYETTQRIRATKKFERLPILAMTADAVATVKEECKRAGMDDYLTKPIQVDTLYKVLAHWVRMYRESSSFRRALDEAPLVSSHSAQLTSTKSEVYLNVSRGLSLLNGNRRLYFKMLTPFRTDYAQVVSKIDTALEGGDRRGAVRLLHTLRGMAAQLGADQLAECALELENALTDQTSAKISAGQLTRFENALQGTFDAIAELLNSEAAVSSPPAGRD